MASVRGGGDAFAMTYARSQIAPSGEYGWFQVVTGCVRRAFLGGSDQLTGKNFDHRRQHRQLSGCGMPSCVDRGPNTFSRNPERNPGQPVAECTFNSHKPFCKPSTPFATLRQWPWGRAGLTMFGALIHREIGTAISGQFLPQP